VRWFPFRGCSRPAFHSKSGGKTTFRSITVDGKEIEFSRFLDYTRVYEDAAPRLVPKAYPSNARDPHGAALAAGCMYLPFLDR
jgi:hypothetical protein